MDFEWDEAKVQTTRRNHAIDFADAVTVFEDEFALTALDDASDEEHFVTLGIDAMERLLAVVYT